MANTSRPCSDASRALISEPLRFAASTTRVPRLSPLISRFLCGKCSRRGSLPMGNSEQTAPFAAMRFASCSLSGRIDLVDAVAEKCDRHRVTVERALMRGSIYAFRQSADDAKARTAKMFREFVGILPALPGWIAASYNCERRQMQCVDVADDKQSPGRARKFASAVRGSRPIPYL